MEISSFIEIGIIGAALSALIEWAKAKYPNELHTKRIAIGASLVVGSLYWFISGTAYYQSVLGVLAAASTVYAVFFKK